HTLSQPNAGTSTTTGMPQVTLPDSHHPPRTFLDSVTSPQPTITPVQTAHHSATPGHLGLIAMLVGRKIKWDANKEVIVNDDEAAKLLSRSYREPWTLS